MSITYVPVPEQFKVKLDGEIVGVIKKAGGSDGYGWRYFPKGRMGGPAFKTLTGCKRSIEG